MALALTHPFPRLRHSSGAQKTSRVMMKNVTLSPPRKKSLNNDFRLPSDISGQFASPSPDSTNGGTTANSDSEMKPPDSPTRSLPSEAPHTESLIESSCDLATKDVPGGKGLTTRGRRGSATMKSFLQRVMRSQSESHIRIAPVAQPPPSLALSSGIVGRKLTTRTRENSEDSCSMSGSEMAGVNALHEEDDNEIRLEETATRTASDTQDVAGSTSCEPTDMIQLQRTQEAVGLCDVFLNSSLQLLQVQSDAKQRVRQLWTCAQKLRWENQLSDTGLELLHQELLNVMKALTVEKLDGTRHIKSGYLTLVQAPPAVLAANALQRGAAAATKSLLFGNPKGTLDQRMWVSVSEEQCRMELVPARNDTERTASADGVASPAPPQQTETGDHQTDRTQSMTNGSATFPGIGKFKLPTSISWLLSDPLQHQQKEDDSAWIGRTTIKLQGCQVRRLPSPGAGVDASRLRFQVLVPHAEAHAGPVSGGSTTVVPDASAACSSSFGIYVFDVLETDGEAERDDWIRTIDRVCAFHLYALESQLREACYMLQFRDILAQGFPVDVPLTWLRNRLERMPANASAMSAQQQASYQYQQLQRRSSRNLSMVQIVKDLERDRILVDHKLLISCMGRSQSAYQNQNEPSQTAMSTTTTTTLSDGTTVEEHDSVAEIVKYLVAKAMAFSRRTTPLKAAYPAGRPPTSSSESVGPSSPSSRLSKFTEAKALAFVERVLRGGSRTQSGGDIYDAIAFFCQQRNLSICPMSHDAHPVQLNVIEDECDFHIEIEVSMQFKVVELAPMASHTGDGGGLAEMEHSMVTTPRDWAVLEGTLTRQFTLGKLSEPGSVKVTYIPDMDDSGHVD